MQKEHSMTTQAHSSYDWVREVNPNLKKLDAIPLTGAPPFPWEALSALLAKAFDREGLTIEPGEIAWRTAEALYEGLGDSPFPLIFSIPSLRGQVCWVMPSQEMDVLAALLLTKESHPLTFHDPDLSESFYRFLALEVLYQLTQLSFDKTLSPILTNQATLPSEDSLCKDIAIGIQGLKIWGRLIISPEFRTSWVEHFAQTHPPAEQTDQLAQLVKINVHLEAGKCQLMQEQWNAIKPGDFILLDTCSLDSDRFNGRVMLTIDGHRAFRAKLKDGTLKILELPLLHEVATPMVKQPEHEDEDDLSDLDLTDEGDQEEMEDEVSFEEDLLSDESDAGIDHEQQTDAPPSAEGTTVQKASPEQAPVQPKMYAPEQIPLNIVVEVGRIQLSMEQLTKLEPGNMLDIDIHPENGVDLTIQGALVGKGELIRIGDVIGVRILQLGKVS